MSDAKRLEFRECQGDVDPPRFDCYLDGELLVADIKDTDMAAADLEPLWEALEVQITWIEETSDE